jgi:hypothetical protein
MECEGVWTPFGEVECFSDAFKYESDWQLSWDHIVPKSMGGTDDPSNLHRVHRGCQSRQGGYISALLIPSEAKTQNGRKGGHIKAERWRKAYGQSRGL